MIKAKKILDCFVYTLFGVIALGLITLLGYQVYAMLLDKNNKTQIVKTSKYEDEKPNQTKIFQQNQGNKNQEKNSMAATTNSIKKDDTRDKAFLKIPLHLQESPLSCEAASLKMALKYRGIELSEDEIMAKIGYAKPYTKEYKNGNVIWGDPDIGYVGNEKGYLYVGQSNLAGGTGWGVNNGPVAKAASMFRPESFEKDRATTEDLKTALRNDQPVIFWHQRDDSLKNNWKYQSPEDKEVNLFQNHVNLLIGFETDKKGETIYTFNDPIYGVIHYSETELLKVWAKYNNEIVVVT